jgi:hypothetical protein
MWCPDSSRTYTGKGAFSPYGEEAPFFNHTEMGATVFLAVTGGLFNGENKHGASEPYRAYEKEN